MTKQRKTWRTVLVFAWVFGILLPLYSFRRFSTNYRVAFDWVFQTHASHVLMHTFLYAVLGCLLCSLFSRPMRSSWRLLVCVLPGVAIVAGLQEAIQTTGEPVVLGGDGVFDFLVDLNGGLLGTMLFVWRAHGRRKAGEKAEPGAALLPRNPQTGHPEGER